MSCHICGEIELQAVGREMGKARSASLVWVLGIDKVWVLLVEERIDGGMFWYFGFFKFVCICCALNAVKLFCSQ